MAAGEAIHLTKLRPKLLQFSENVRPAYFGTWRKKSSKLSARNPLKQDKVSGMIHGFNLNPFKSFFDFGNLKFSD